MRFSTLAAVAALTTTLSAGAAQAATTIVVGGPGKPDAGDCAPFSCAQRYQQAFDSSLFAGEITIVGLTFYNTERSPGALAEGDYTVRFSTGGGQVGALSNTFANNLGVVHDFFAGHISGPASPSFTIAGAAFTYNPLTDGDLLLDITSNAPLAFSVYMDHRTEFAGFQRLVNFSNRATGSLGANQGLVTGFVVEEAIPEPSTWALMILGFGAAGAMLRGARRGARAHTGG
ncbi:PEPxxWA-CTERM sorting domain-containing protein [Phenylobacterium sp.]|uniref:PEPxxWA-CTERM sorting domain-containing protein n=1 Tax=Phenylobacterium sp. TaxID=1871053 RepID=UPI002ED96618